MAHLWGFTLKDDACTKPSLCYTLLRKYAKMREALCFDGSVRPRFTAAFIMNGAFRFWPTATFEGLETILKYMDDSEGFCRCHVPAALFVDNKTRSIHCVDRPSYNHPSVRDFVNLTKEGGWLRYWKQ